MRTPNAYKRSRVILILLSAYIVLQFLWWGFMLVQDSPKKTIMVFGEGTVFLIILFYGIYRYQLSIQRELTLHQRQSNFLLSVTHELKTPIAAVQLILQTIRKHNLSQAEQQSFLEQALMENKKSENLIQNMLYASGLENKHLQTHLSALYPEELVIQIRTKINEGSYIDAVQFSVLSNQPFQADLNLLERVIIQLIENSFKYDSTQVDIHIHQQNNQMEIDIIDNGSGISEADRPFIFDKFFRSGDENKREKTGTGLGLFIAKEFVELQKGALTFKPNLPKGTVFTIKLPQ